MSERCVTCIGIGEVFDDDLDLWVTCPTCVGLGLDRTNRSNFEGHDFFDPYFDDEWYEDEDAWENWESGLFLDDRPLLTRIRAWYYRQRNTLRNWFNWHILRRPF